MKRVVTALLVLILGLCVAQRFASAAEPTDSRLAQIKALIAQRNYRDALQALQATLAQTPNDPLAIAYRQICEQQLGDVVQLPRLSPEDLQQLSERLKHEEQEQRRVAAQNQALDRVVQREQAQWEAELKQAERDAARQAKAQQHQAQQTAVKQRRQTTIAAASASPAPSPEPSREAPPEVPSGAVPPPRRSEGEQPVQEPAAGRREEGIAPGSAGGGEPPVEEPAMPTITPSGKGTVELAPIVVGGKLAEAPVEESGEEQILPGGPPGSVQMFADQMSVSPDRQIARAQGHVRVVFQGGVLTCDKMTMFTDTRDVYAQGHVRLDRGEDRFVGEMIHYNLNTKKGRILEGTVFRDPWYQHGESIEHIAEGVVRVRPGYLTSCEFLDPHYRLQGRENTVFLTDRMARGQGVTLFAEHMPLFFFPSLTVADRQSPFFIIPGQRKPWGPFVLMGYRNELPSGHRLTWHLDWRRYLLWGMGVDDLFDSDRFGRGLIKIYYNEEQNIKRLKVDLPKGAAQKRYRVLFRHNWQPLPDTSVVADLQKYSDSDFRKEMLYHEEFLSEPAPESFVSIVTSHPDYTISLLNKKRLNRFQTMTEELPQAVLAIKPQQIGDSQFFVESRTEYVNFNTKNANSEVDVDESRLDEFEQLSYAMNLFRPILITPKAGVRETYYNKDKQGSDREGKRHFISGQFSGGIDASLKLFRIYPIVTNALGLDLNWIRHVISPTITYVYDRPATVPNELLSFPAAPGPTNQITLGLENKLQTKRRSKVTGKMRSVDLTRFLISLPYTMRGSGNRDGGQFGDWNFNWELYPWPWMRLETNLPYPSRFQKGSRDSRVTIYNLDLVMVGGHGESDAQHARKIQAPLPAQDPGYDPTQASPLYRAFSPGPQEGINLLPQGQWYLGLGHRYSYNDKTESVLEFDWGLSPKWEIGTFHRFTWKEVAAKDTGGTVKRFNDLRETQYVLKRDLHDWIAEVVYRVDREFGEELYFTMTLKAYPNMPIQTSDSYHQPKLGSQSSPFSPIHTTSQ